MSSPSSDTKGDNGLHYCLIKGCATSNGFKRKADLQRHYDQIHPPKENKKQFYCDYQRCERHSKPFGRIDHFRDHYREFHREDLPRQAGETREWWSDRKNVPKKWYRCVKCLEKNYIKDHGEQCAKCGSTCEPQRLQLRGY